MKRATCAWNAGLAWTFRLAWTSRLVWTSRLNGRFLLACVLMFSIPLQVIASTRLLACGQNHHRISTLAVQTTKSLESLRLQAEAANMLDHGIAHCVEPGSDEPPSWNSPQQGTQSKCNSCAPCCTVSALVSEIGVFLENSLLNMDFPAVLPLQWPALVGTPERPPRSILG